MQERLALGAFTHLAGWLPQNRAGQQERQGAVDSALDVLKKRYARGEITKAEYKEMRQDLES